MEFSLNPCGTFLIEELSTYDVMYSTERFLSERFKGCVVFPEVADLGAPKNVLIDKYALAYVFKSIIKELTPRRVCSITFSVSDDGLMIRFHSREKEPLTGIPLSRITGAADFYGVEVRIDGVNIIIVLPTSPLRRIKVYEKHIYRFLIALEAVFDED